MKIFTRNAIKTLFSAFFVIAVLTFGTQMAKADDSSITVSVSSTQAEVGDTINVSVKLHNSDGITHAQYELVYNANIFEYVSGSVQGASGVVPINVMGTVEEQTDYEHSFVFKAIEVGKSDFSISNMSGMINTDAEIFTPAITNASVSVVAAGSDDASLSKLEVVGGAITPGFNPDVYDYSIPVTSETTGISINAITTQGGKVEISNNRDNLVYGENVITVVSYAPNGSTRTYRIHVNRPEPQTEAPTEPATEPTVPAPVEPTEPVTEPSWENPSEEQTEPVGAPGTVVIGDVNYTIAQTIDPAIAPYGYVASSFEYDGVIYSSLYNVQYDITLAFLFNANGDGLLFMYNPESKTVFYPYNEINDNGRKYIVANAEDSSEFSDELNEVFGEIKGVQFKCYMLDKDSEFLYFYGINDKGECSWYSFDKTESTIQKAETVVKAKDEPSEEETEKDSPDISAEKIKIKQLEKKIDGLNKDKKGLSNSRKKIILICSIVLVFMLGVVLYMLIFLILKDYRKKQAEDISNEEENASDDLVIAEDANKDADK